MKTLLFQAAMLFYLYFFCSSSITLMAQTGALPSGATVQKDDSERFELRWKFRPGEIIKVDQSIRTEYQSLKDVTLQEYRYYWVVRDVKEDGRALLSLVFEDATFSANDPEKFFRASVDDKSLVLNHPGQRSFAVYQARTLFDSEVELAVEPDGSTEVLRGAESLPSIGTFTPGDLPGLPKQPVAIGESWKVPIGSDLATGEAICTLSGIEMVDGHRVANIDSVVTWGQLTPQYEQAANIKLEPSKIASRFDLDSGKFLKDENRLKVRVLESQNAGKEVSEPPRTLETLSLELQRRLADVEKAPEPKSNSGEYVLALRDNGFDAIVLAGISKHKKSEPVRQTTEMLFINFYHDWKDTDGDNSPSPWELKDISRRFRTDEKTRLLLTFVGMESRHIRLDIVDAFGLETYSGAIPIKAGPASFAVREAEFPEGVYFFEFFIDNRFELRVPVRVVSVK